MKLCPKCNTQYSDDKRFCKTCRVPLTAALTNTETSQNAARPVVENEKGFPNQQPHTLKPHLKNRLILGSSILLMLLVCILIYMLYSPNEEPGVPEEQSVTTDVSTDSELPHTFDKSSSFEENNQVIDFESLVNDTVFWRLEKQFLFDKNGKPKNEKVEYFISLLGSSEGEGSPVSQSEFENILNQSDAKLVYAKELIRYATPLSDKIQKKEHQDYTRIFMKEKRIKNGIQFLHDYESLLSDAENKYGIPRKDLVSILMWESGLGEFTGDYQIFNIFLEQIVFMDYAQEYAVRKIVQSGEPNPLFNARKSQKEAKRLQKRCEDAAKNLASLIRLSKLNNQNPLSFKGSWGGAIGFVQFMPYNLIYAVDGNNDGTVDLFNFHDAVFSAANYLIVRGKYGSSEKSRRDAIFSYNRSIEYVDGVILYADTIWSRYQAGE